MKAQWLTLRRLAILFGAAALLGTASGYLVDKGVWAFVEPLQTLIGAFYANVSAELLSIVVTIVVIDALNQRRAVAQQKADLILQMSSPDNAIAVEAARILKARGWGFEDDTTLHGVPLGSASLQGVILSGANLQGAHLIEANLERARLWGANLRVANLSEAYLQEAELSEANLQGASLEGANLQEVHLLKANLQGVRLGGANLRGTYLHEANLQGAILVTGGLEGVFEVKFDEATTLPDGSHWTSDTDMRRFTDPSHPDFWRSDNSNSPAYRGKGDD